jgi:hypothetical protein
VQELVALREGHGLRVAVVDVQDIYDEFAYGLSTPAAIKDFLTYAYQNWRAPAPQYVLLAGDSSYDFKDNWGIGTVNPVLAYLTYTEYMGETVTDEWFVTISGQDAVPDMYIGRLPAADAAQAAVMAAKIVAYETTANTKSWEKDILLVADDRQQEFEAVFETMNEDAAGLVPATMNLPYKGYLADYLDAGFAAADLRDDILNQINAGTLMVNFSGHGHLQGWTTESVFDASDIDMLANTGKYPFMVSMSCLTGYFAYPEAWASSLAEQLLRAPDKGTAAALMPTGMTRTEGQHVLNNALFETIFTEDVRRLGPAVSKAKQVLLANGDAYFEQISATFLLFGDPAMKLKVPLPRRPEGLEAAFRDQGGVTLRWEAALDGDEGPVAGYNVYRRSASSDAFTKLNRDIIHQTEYIDWTASANAYIYKVTAVDKDGAESIPSATVSLVPPVPPPDNGGSGGEDDDSGSSDDSGGGASDGNSDSNDSDSDSGDSDDSSGGDSDSGDSDGDSGDISDSDNSDGGDSSKGSGGSSDGDKKSEDSDGSSDLCFIQAAASGPQRPFGVVAALAAVVASFVSRARLKRVFRKK